jgi:hypothetical protein
VEPRAELLRAPADLLPGYVACRVH